MDYIIATLSEGRKWAKILGVVFIVMFALQCLSVFTSGFFIGGLMLIISGLLYLLPGLMLFKYAKAVESAESGSDPVSDVEEACAKQSKYFQFVGIAAALAVVLAIVGFLLIIFFGVSGFGHL